MSFALNSKMNALDKHKTQIDRAIEWINEAEAYAKTLGSELEKQKSNKYYLNNAMQRVDKLIKTGDEHSQRLTQVTKAIQTYKSMANATGVSADNDTNKKINEFETNAKRLQDIHKTLKGFREKIGKFVDNKTEGQ